MRRLALALAALVAALLLGAPSVTMALVRPVDVIVHFGGLGAGRVTSDPPAMDCTSDCTVQFEWLQDISLTAEAQNGGTFAGWQDGPCDGSTNPVCAFQVPATYAEMTAVFDPIAPPISAPPGPTPSPTGSQLTPPPPPTARASTGGLPTKAPVTTAPATETPTDATASMVPTATTSGSMAAPTAVPAPTIVGLDDQGAAAGSSGPGLLVVILLIVVLGGLVGAGVYWFTKRRQAAA